MYETHVTVQGRLVADPLVKDGRNGSFTTFRVAQSERHRDRQDPSRWVDSEASFYDVRVFRGMGDNAARCLKKGHPVVVTGKLRVRQYRRDDGSYGAATEIDADALGHDLRWGVTTYTRNGDVEPALPQGPEATVDLGDPEHDPYVLADGSSYEPANGGLVDSGPLVTASDEQAA